MDNCVFCQIVARTMPCDLIYQDDRYMAFLDINPVHPGHTLVIPKEHHQMIVDTPDELVAGSFVLAKKIMIAMKEALGCDFVMISVVGTDVPHFHIQLIPRSTDDGLHGWPTMQYQAGQGQEVADQIRQKLS